MKKWILPVVIVGGIAAFYFLGKSRLSKVKLLFRGVGFSGGIFHPRFNLKFGIQNPTTEKANINSLVGTLTANGKTVANISSFTTQIIAPTAESIYKVTAEPAAGGIISTISNFLKNKNKVKFNFTGSMNIDNINYPVNENLSL